MATGNGHAKTTLAFVLAILAALLVLILVGIGVALTVGDDLVRGWHFLKFVLYPPEPVLPP
jgi:ABC-type sugar transport system permease subunit